MKQVKLINEETDYELIVNVKDSWNEITLKTYFELAKIDSKSQDVEILLQQICLLTDAKMNDLLEIPTTELTKISSAIESVVKEAMPTSSDEFIIVDNTIYVPKRNFSILTTNETIYIKTIENSISDTEERALSMLAILIRPGYKKEVSGKDKYIQYPLNEEDFEERKKVFREKLPTTVALSVLNAFMSGTRK